MGELTVQGAARAERKKRRLEVRWPESGTKAGSKVLTSVALLRPRTALPHECTTAAEPRTPLNRHHAQHETADPACEKLLGRGVDRRLVTDKV